MILWCCRTMQKRNIGSNIRLISAPILFCVGLVRGAADSNGIVLPTSQRLQQHLMVCSSTPLFASRNPMQAVAQSLINILIFSQGTNGSMHGRHRASTAALM
jgi:hypothetical protein